MHTSEQEEQRRVEQARERDRERLRQATIFHQLRLGILKADK